MTGPGGDELVFANGRATFRARLGAQLATGGSGLVQAGERVGERGSIVVKRARRGSERLLEIERRAGERLAHPNVVRYLGSARGHEGTFVAFERLAPNPVQLLSDPALRPRFRDPGSSYFPLPPGTALELAFDLACALEYLHGQGLVHGDVKLANFLVRTPEPGAGPREVLAQVARGAFEGVLIDLGSLRQAETAGALPDPTESGIGSTLTPLYAPPEALMENALPGRRLSFAPAMDVYALGFVVYVLATGHVPYERFCQAHEARHPLVLDELKLREARGDLAPLDFAALDEIPLHDVAFVGGARAGWPQFRSRLEHLIRGCVHADAARRFTASEVRSFLERELRLRPADAGSPRKWVQGLFRMRPLSNRLTGDAPLGGIVVKLEGTEATGEERAVPSPGDSRVVKAIELVAPSKALAVPVPALVTAGLDSTDPTELAAARVLSLEELARRRGPRRITVGRDAGCDLVLAEPDVSARHAALERTATGWVLVDLRSNGTWVDGRRVAPGGRAPLGPGFAAIRLGSARISFLNDVELAGRLADSLRALVRVADPVAPECAGRPLGSAA